MVRDESCACVFCGYLLRVGARGAQKGGQKHHFPLPARFGGEATVPVCNACHERADRMPLAHTDLSWVVSTFMGMWGKLSADERIVLWKMYVGILEAQAVLEGDADAVAA